jgi:hypothetical protein
MSLARRRDSSCARWIRFRCCISKAASRSGTWCGWASTIRAASTPADSMAIAAPSPAMARFFVAAGGRRVSGYGCRIRRGSPKSTRTAAIVAWRAGHAMIAVGFLTSIGYVWWCAVTGRRDRWLRRAIVALAGEGAVVALNHGDCPLGPLGDRIGDQVPLFELVLPPRAARLAVPVLGGVTAAGVGLLAARSALAAHVSDPRPATPGAASRRGPPPGGPFAARRNPRTGRPSPRDR